MSATEVHPDMSASAGPLLLGYLFNWGLFGVLSIQVYFYYVSFMKDHRIVKSIVYAIYMIELVQTIIVTHDAFVTFARGFGDVAQLGSPQLEWFATPILSGIVSCTVQLFYSHRVYVFSRSRILTATVIMISLLQCGAAIYEGTQARITDYKDLALSHRIYVSCTIWLAGSATCDVLIAASMTYLLLSQDTGLRKTHIMVRKLVRLIIETGTLTATMTVIDLALFLGFPGKAYHACTALMLAKLYSNSLLALFNSRIQIKNLVDAENLSSFVAQSRPTSGEMQRGTGPAFSFAETGPSVVHIQGDSWMGTDSVPNGTVKKPRSLAEDV